MEISEKDLLNYALENGIINIGTIQMQVEMNNRQKYLKEHPYSVWLGKDGFWHSYLPKGEGRQAIKKKTQEDIETSIINFYKQQDKSNECFKQRWDCWITRQRNCGRSENTILKYQSDYKRFFKGYDIENKCIKEIDDEYLCAFIKQLLADKPISKRALKDLFGYTNGLFIKSIKDGLIRENPCNFIDLPIFYKYCADVTKDASRRVLKNGESEAVIKNIKEKKLRSDDMIPGYLVELSLCTGMRVGEIAGLKWSDIDYENEVINIVRSEKQNKKTKEYYLANTKNDKKRVFPLIDTIKEILEELKHEQIRMGCLSEFIACNQKGKINVNNLSKYGNRWTKTDKCAEGYSIHAIRRTLNSNLRCSGVSATVASALLGHSEKVNELNYTVDITTIQDKIELVKSASLI